MGFSMTVSLIVSKLPATPIKGIAIPCPAPMSPRKHLALEQRQDMLCCYGQVKRLAAQRGKRREAWLFFSRWPKRTITDYTAICALPALICCDESMLL